jgi:predicted transcriptional regulator
MKDLLQFSDKTKTTTVATLLRMIDKDFVAYTEFGNSREYYPLVKKTDYFSKHVNGLITNFSTIRPHSSLPSSPKQFIINGIGDLKKIIDGELQKKKK